MVTPPTRVPWLLRMSLGAGLNPKTPHPLTGWFIFPAFVACPNQTPGRKAGKCGDRGKTVGKQTDFLQLQEERSQLIETSCS